MSAIRKWAERAWKAEADRDAAKEALRNLLDRYVGLVNSGDAGHWDPELEPEVIKARAAIG